MTSAAWPDDDGTRNAIGMFTRNAEHRERRGVGLPDTPSSIQCRTVSVM